MDELDADRPLAYGRRDALDAVDRTSPTANTRRGSSPVSTEGVSAADAREVLLRQIRAVLMNPLPSSATQSVKPVVFGLAPVMRKRWRMAWQKSSLVRESPQMDALEPAIALEPETSVKVRRRESSQLASMRWMR